MRDQQGNVKIPATGTGAAGKVFAVIVAYHPDEDQMHHLLQRLSTQCSGMVLICNSPLTLPSREHMGLQDGFVTVHNNENVGLAEAQNQGITLALKAGAEWLVLFDQDSMPSETHVASLLLAHRTLVAQGHQVATVGPRLFDVHANALAPFYLTGWYRTFEVYEDGMSATTPCSYVLSSGALVHAEVFRDVGLLEPSLFIHNVDLEWCFRAAGLGYQSFGCFDITMNHTVGDRQIRLFGRQHPIYSRHRQYFIFRNSVLLLQMRHVPSSWKINEIARVIPRLVVYSVFAPQAFSHFKAGLLGLLDGLLHRGPGFRQPEHFS